VSDGTCYYGTARDYYDITEVLFKELDIPNIKKLLSEINVSATTIKNEFLNLNPKLYTNDIIIEMNGKKLKAVKICYDLNYKFATCKQ
ncbi:unnamed protein product, partial [Didymodactylos carnosus]